MDPTDELSFARVASINALLEHLVRNNIMLMKIETWDDLLGIAFVMGYRLIEGVPTSVTLMWDTNGVRTVAESPWKREVE